MESFVSAPTIAAFHGTKLRRGGQSRCTTRPCCIQPRACAERSVGVNRVFEEPKHDDSQTEESLLEEQLAKEETDSDVDNSEPAEGDDTWYQIEQPIGKSDTEGFKKKDMETVLSNASGEGPVDLAALDGMGREMLTGASYDTIVDVDIEEGGVLELDDEDNNELFCGVGLDALIESEQIMTNLREGLNINTATHVQLAGIPRVLDGKDIVIQSHTGTGKTLVFLLPLMDSLDVEIELVQGIIVAPTRELAMQIFRECERLAEGTRIRAMALIGGANPARQVDKLRKKQPHIVVGTPGRVAEMQENRELRVHGVQMLVVDEADQCMQPSFAEDVVYLLKKAPRRVQKVLVSATSDVDSVRAFAGQYLHKPVLLRVGGAQRLPKNITHYYCVVPARMRIDLLRKLMNAEPMPTRAIVFVDDPRRVDIVVDRLYQMKIGAGALRGNAHKLERAEVLTAFRKGRINLLVTTEIAARGLDIPEISHVFNLDLPTDGDHYVHRAGRSGRAGNPGAVVSVATADTAFVIGRLEKELGVKISRIEPRGGAYRPVVERKRSDVGKRSGVQTRGDRGVSDQRKRAQTGAVAGRQGLVRDRSRQAPGIATREAGKRTIMPRQDQAKATGVSQNIPVTRHTSSTVSEDSPDDSELAGADLFDGENVDEETATELLAGLGVDVRAAGTVQEESAGVQNAKKKAKKKVKKTVSKGTADAKDSEKAKVKKRWRDTKNKGKPKGPVGRPEEGAGIEGRGGQGEGSGGGARSSARPTRRTVRPPEKNVAGRAKKEGWVGNR